MSHFKKVCEYGKTHGQCRCMGPHRVIKVVCDNPDHRPLQVVTDEPLTIFGRFDRVLDEQLWWLKDEQRTALNEALEQEVIDWLKQSADTLRKDS